MTDSRTLQAALWETDHPYYATHGCFYAGPLSHGGVPHENWQSWADFMEGWGDSDLDYNLLYRWDWHTPDPGDYEPEEAVPGDTLELFFMLQRKAKPYSHTIRVTRDDEPVIREWLTVRAEHLRKVWEPLLTPVTGPDQLHTT